jgi:hypothetical protein
MIIIGGTTIGETAAMIHIDTVIDTTVVIPPIVVIIQPEKKPSVLTDDIARTSIKANIPMADTTTRVKLYPIAVR